MNKQKTWEEEVMRILIEYDDRYSMASLEILMDKIRPVIKQEILNVLDEVEQVYKGKPIGVTRTTSGEVRFYVWHDELYAKIEEIKKRYEK